MWTNMQISEVALTVTKELLTEYESENFELGPVLKSCFYTPYFPV